MKKELLRLCVLVLGIYLFLGCTSTGGGNNVTNISYNDASDFEYKIEGNGENRSITIIGYIGERKDVNIPPFIDGFPVTKIDAPRLGFESKPNRFFSKNLRVITFPDGIISISGDFHGNDLLSLTFPNSVITIIGMFGSKLRSITIPDSVTSLARAFFYTGDNLREVTLPGNLTLAEQSKSFDSNLLPFYMLFNREKGTYTRRGDEWLLNGNRKSEMERSYLQSEFLMASSTIDGIGIVNYWYETKRFEGYLLSPGTHGLSIRRSSGGYTETLDWTRREIYPGIYEVQTVRIPNRTSTTTSDINFQAGKRYRFSGTGIVESR